MFFSFRLSGRSFFAAACLIIASITAIILLCARPEETLTASATVEPRPVLVIDPGHGGEDGGAVSADGTPESGINLEIALRLHALAGLCGTDTVLTRDSEHIDYPAEMTSTAKRKVWDQHARVELIASIECATLISIHQNKYPDRRPRGPQVLYAVTDGSDELASIMQANLTAALWPENRRVAAPVADSIYLMRSVGCTAVLVECGFMSNPDESQLLSQSAYQLKTAAVICASYLQFCEENV